MRLTPQLLAYTALGIMAADSGAQSDAANVALVLRIGDSVSGVGSVTSIKRFAVNDAGTWIVAVDTDAPSSSSNGVILRGGVEYLQEGDALAEPAGATAGATVDAALGPVDQVAHIVGLGGVAGGNHVAVLRDGELIVQSRGTALGSGFGPGTTYDTFRGVLSNNLGNLLVRGDAKDPTTMTPTDEYLGYLQIDALGNPTNETVIVRKGQLVIPGAPAVDDVAFFDEQYALDDLGRAIHFVDLDFANLPDDGVVLLWNGVRNVVVAREGAASPVAGEVWGALGDAKVSIHATGGWALAAGISGPSTTNELLVRNGVKVVRQGDALGAGLSLYDFGSAAIQVTASGSVVYFAHATPTSAAQDGCIVRDTTVLFRESQFTVRGQLVTEMLGGRGDLAVSPNGRFAMFRCDVGGVDSVVIADLEASIASFCAGDGTATACPCGNVGLPGNGCANSVVPSGARLEWSGSVSVWNDDLVLTGSGMPPAACLYFQGTLPAGGGAGVVFGDGLRCVTGTIVRLGVKTNDAAGTSRYPDAGELSVAERGLIPTVGGVSRAYQCWYRNVATFCAPATFNLTNGVAVTWGV